MLKKIFFYFFLCSLASSVCSFATTPSGGWTLKNDSFNSKDYFTRIDVDPGESYANSGFAPSSVYWAQYITFNQANGGYLGLQRANGNKLALVSIWDGLDAKAGILPVAQCDEFGPCKSIKGNYNWKVGHNYRFRVEHKSRNSL